MPVREDPRGARPPGVPDSAVSIGPRLRALAVYLLVFQHLPVERCLLLLSDIAGADVSAGFIHSCLAAAASMAAGVVKLIKMLIIASKVVGFDETTLRSGAAGEKEVRPRRVHREILAVPPRHPVSGDHEGLRDLAGFAGIAVTDRYGNYFHTTWKNISGHQACVQHLLRDLQDCAETYPGTIWPGQAQEALRALIHARNQASGDGLDAIPAAIREPLQRQFRGAITVALAGVPRIPGPKNSTKQHPGRDMLEFCRDRDADVLRFTTDTDVWPTNNISESGLRPNKTQQKVSGRLTSDDTTQDRLDIRGYIDTARKHGCHVLDVLHALSPAAPGRPRFPARPDPAYLPAQTRHAQHLKHHPRHTGECLRPQPINGKPHLRVPSMHSCTSLAAGSRCINDPTRI